MLSFISPGALESIIHNVPLILLSALLLVLLMIFIAMLRENK
jgi:hypothetical protein